MRRAGAQLQLGAYVFSEPEPAAAARAAI